MVALNEEEMRAVLWALDNYLPELAYDLARIDRERDRHEVAAFERTLAALRERLHDDLAQRPVPAA